MQIIVCFADKLFMMCDELPQESIRKSVDGIPQAKGRLFILLHCKILVIWQHYI